MLNLVVTELTYTKGKNMLQLMKEGRPLAAAGQVYLEATASAPTTLEAIFLTAAGAPQGSTSIVLFTSSRDKSTTNFGTKT